MIGGDFNATGFGPTILRKELDGTGTATLTTFVAHGLVVGDTIVVTNVDSTFDGTYTITSVPGVTSLQYSRVGGAVNELVNTTASILKASARFNRIARLNLDGTQDGTAIFGAAFDNGVSTMIRDASGRLTVGGSFTSYQNLTGPGMDYLTRLDDTGGTFNGDFNVSSLSLIHI